MFRRLLQCLFIGLFTFIVACEKFESDSNNMIKGKAIPVTINALEDGSYMSIFLFYKANCANYYPQSSVCKTAYTDASGNFTFMYLPRGDYIVAIQAQYFDNDSSISNQKGTYYWDGRTCIQINGEEEIIVADIEFTEYFVEVDTSITSCPYLYSWEDSGFLFRGEIYSGAVYKSLQRDDYFLLDQLKPQGNSMVFKLSNERDEIHYTDLVQLIYIENAEASRNIADKSGNIQTLASLQKPFRATADGVKDISSTLAQTDQHYYRFMDDRRNDAGNFFNSVFNKVREFLRIEDKSSIPQLTMEFKRPKGAKTAKLYISARNPAWTANFYYHGYLRNFGTYLPEWIEEQNSASAEDQMQWALNQGTPLSIYLKTKSGWTFVDYFHNVGARGKYPREMVLPLDLTDIEGENVEVRLECGYNFWEVDRAALDFSANKTGAIYRFPPASVRSDLGESLISGVMKKDNQYLTMRKGEQVILTFPFPADYSPEKYSVIFLSNGYYNTDPVFTNSPDWMTLILFKFPGSYTNLAKRHFQLVHKVI